MSTFGQMSSDYDVYHGASGDKILMIINEGKMNPGSDHKVWYSAQLEDTFQHGADEKRLASLAFRARITLPAGASMQRDSTKGNDLAIVVTTALPVPTKVIELYVRRLRPTPSVEVVKGIERIRGYLLQHQK
jgi:hypothetical protein